MTPATTTQAATNQGAIAIFVKTPGHSAIKTRLALGTGERYALDWYTHSARAVASVVREAAAQCGVVAYWAVAEQNAEMGNFWRELPIIAQGEGGLGERMARVHATLVQRHGFGMLIGADTPQITTELLCDGAQWLNDRVPRAAIGPAADGGFWLFGSNRAPAIEEWTSVTYSAPHTACRLCEEMVQLGQWRTLTELCDLDSTSDIPVVAQALQDLPQATAEQQALRDWMAAQDASQ